MEGIVKQVSFLSGTRVLTHQKPLNHTVDVGAKHTLPRDAGFGTQWGEEITKNWQRQSDERIQRKENELYAYRDVSLQFPDFRNFCLKLAVFRKYFLVQNKMRVYFSRKFSSISGNLDSYYTYISDYRDVLRWPYCLIILGVTPGYNFCSDDLLNKTFMSYDEL